MTLPWVDAEAGAGLRFRRLTAKDAPLLVEATGDETAPALWGPYPAGPYTLADATAALGQWSAEQVSFGLRAGFRFGHRAADHCPTWENGVLTGSRHDCLIYLHP
jgi:hypothetical protein